MHQHGLDASCVPLSSSWWPYSSAWVFNYKPGWIFTQEFFTTITYVFADVLHSTNSTICSNVVHLYNQLFSVTHPTLLAEIILTPRVFLASARGLWLLGGMYSFLGAHLLAWSFVVRWEKETLRYSLRWLLQPTIILPKKMIRWKFVNPLD